MAASDQLIFDLIRKSLGYRLTDPRDRRKVELALDNKPSNRPSSAICEAAWHLAKRDTVGPNPPAPTPPPDPEPEPNPPAKLAPQSFNKGSRGQNAKFNIRINCSPRGDGKYVDEGGFVYSDSGLCEGGRSEPNIFGLKPSDEADSLEPWDTYIGPDGKPHPPYPPESYLP